MKSFLFNSTIRGYPGFFNIRSIRKRSSEVNLLAIEKFRGGTPENVTIYNIQKKHGLRATSAYMPYFSFFKLLHPQVCSRCLRNFILWLNLDLGN